MLWICKAFDVVHIGIEETFQFFIAGFHQDGDWFAWSNIHLATCVTDSTNQVFQAFNTFMRSFILKG